MSDYLPKNAKFSLGQIVYHSKFKYRGVIVDADPNFQGTDEWYDSVAKSKPDKNKPWYHVLVHDSGGLSTYVAQSNLKQDVSGQAIDHPRLGCYFTKLENGRYGLKENHNTGACSI